MTDDRLSAFGRRFGFFVTAGPDLLEAENVPCLLKDRVVGSCTITQSYDPETGKSNKQIGNALHAVRITTDQECDGRVYAADGNPIGAYLAGDKKSWSDISVRKGSPDRPEDDESARASVYRYAKRIVGAVAAFDPTKTTSLSQPEEPFKIPNAFEARAGIGPVQNRIRDQRIAIIGLGGTGSYVLGPRSQDTRAANPSVGFRSLWLAHLHASTGRAYRRRDRGPKREGLEQSSVLSCEVRRASERASMRTSFAWRTRLG